MDEVPPKLVKEFDQLVIQYLLDRNLYGSARKVGQETGLLMDMEYVEKLTLTGSLDELDNYLLQFTNMDSCKESMLIFFHIRKQKYFEALDSGNSQKAVVILRDELKRFEKLLDKAKFDILLYLLSLQDIRMHETMSEYGDTTTARSALWNVIKTQIVNNKDLSNKLHLPSAIPPTRMVNLVNQSFYNSHIVNCRNPKPYLIFTSLFEDHDCDQESSSEDPSGVSQSAGPSAPGVGEIITGAPQTAVVTHPGSSTGNIVADNQTEELPKMLQYSENLPRIDFLSLNHIAGGASMDFHPTLEILLVGTQVGDVELWNIAKSKKIAFRNFKLWNLKHCPVPVRVVADESSISVNKVRWSADRLHFGVAYSKYLVHVYRYLLNRDLQDQLEINAHDGCVNDVAFYWANGTQNFVTCGDDKTVKVWTASSGEKRFTLNHQAPVFSILPYQKDGTDYIYSVSNDGKIHVWNDKVLEVAHNAPGSCCTRMSYTTDGSRLFSCGTTAEGNTHLVEWDESDGLVKRTYEGLCFSSSGMVHFDTFQDRYLAAGDESVIKIWDMDNSKVLVTVTKDGLPVNPCFKFNTKGSLLAVTLDTGGVHVLATGDWIQNRHIADISKVDSEAGEHSHADELGDTSKIWLVPEITELSQCRAMKLNDKASLIRNCLVSRLTYSHSGGLLVALASIGVHSVWKWQKTDENTAGNATTTEQPRKYRSQSEALMINEFYDQQPKDKGNWVSCFALSKSDSHLISSSGGSVSLFELVTFEKKAIVNSPPPQAMSFAFHPVDTKIVAMGMGNSAIYIYNIQQNKVTNKLKYHRKEVTGLAFSAVLGVLVSSGADGQLCVWGTGKWRREDSMFLKIPTEQVHSSGIHVQFHHDEKHFLAVHETLLFIYRLEGSPSKLQSVSEWPDKSRSGIKCATYSCDGLCIYACLGNGTVGVLTAEPLELVLLISPDAYIPLDIRENSEGVYPSAIAAHPSIPNQLALGLTNGGVYVIEPLESAGQWGARKPSEEAASSADN